VAGLPEEIMEKKSWIVTLVAAGAVVGLGFLAPAATAAAAEPRPGDAGRPGPGDPDRGSRPYHAPSGSDYHADYHADYSANRDGGGARQTRDGRRDARREESAPAPFPEPRYRRPLDWRR
jgi:hypothetical protein